MTYPDYPEGYPEANRDDSGNSKTAWIVSAIAAVLITGGVLATLIVTGGDDNPTPPTIPPLTSEPTQTVTQTPPVTQTVTQTPPLTITETETETVVVPPPPPVTTTTTVTVTTTPPLVP